MSTEPKPYSSLQSEKRGTHFGTAQSYREKNGRILLGCTLGIYNCSVVGKTLKPRKAALRLWWEVATEITWEEHSLIAHLLIRNEHSS